MLASHVTYQLWFGYHQAELFEGDSTGTVSHLKTAFVMMIHKTLYRSITSHLFFFFSFFTQNSQRSDFFYITEQIGSKTGQFSVLYSTQWTQSSLQMGDHLQRASLCPPQSSCRKLSLCFRVFQFSRQAAFGIILKHSYCLTTKNPINVEIISNN